MVIETLLGSLFGGFFRLAPDVIKHFDKKNDRHHELLMFDKQLEMDKARADAAEKQLQIQADSNAFVAGVEAIKEALHGQAEMAVAAGGWAAKLSASVRPMVTYMLAALYMGSKAAGFWLAYIGGGLSAPEAIIQIYGPEDAGILSGILSFWFLDRVMRRPS